MNKFLVLCMAAGLALPGIAGADGKKGGKGQSSDAAPTAPATQNGGRVASTGGPRYLGQGQRPINSAGVPISRRNAGNLPLQRNGTVNGVPNWRVRQLDNRVLADQTAIPRRTWKTLDQLRNGEQNLPLQNMRGRRNRDRDDATPSENTTKGGQDDRIQSDPTKVAVANNWRNRGNKVVPFDNSNTVSFSDARRRCHDFGRDRHDRNWWHNRCSTIILISGGFWAWDAGWWYPAWGYDPYYSNYAYNGPVYGYDGLPPDQVIANVQGALQEMGYFPYAVDGVLGPTTQQAIADYQSDQGLNVTGAVDRPTLASLGFVY